GVDRLPLRVRLADAGIPWRGNERVVTLDRAHTTRCGGLLGDQVRIGGRDGSRAGGSGRGSTLPTRRNRPDRRNGLALQVRSSGSLLAAAGHIFLVTGDAQSPWLLRGLRSLS